MNRVQHASAKLHWDRFLIALPLHRVLSPLRSGTFSIDSAGLDASLPGLHLCLGERT
ncbi:hypothetical protein GGQ18_002946 [Salinibacter ruber]|nr:hypothetical protein [Salinibacter ruber]